MSVQMLEQADVHRRHAHEGRRTLVRERFNDALRVETLLEEKSEPRQERAGDSEAEPVHVEQRKREYEAVVRAEVPEIHHRARVLLEGAMRQRDALALARRARRVDQEGHIVAGGWVASGINRRRKGRKICFKRKRGKDLVEMENVEQRGGSSVRPDLVEDDRA